MERTYFTRRMPLLTSSYSFKISGNGVNISCHVSPYYYHYLPIIVPFQSISDDVDEKNICERKNVSMVNVFNCDVVVMVLNIFIGFLCGICRR